MTKIVPDTVDVTCLIGGKPWHVIEAKVELSQVATPNFVDMVITPDPNETVPDLPEAGNISEIVGQTFELYADNQLISERVTEAGEDSTLFIGNLGNISPTGENTFEAIAYDPSQQGFNIGEDSGSVINMSFNLDKVRIIDPDTISEDDMAESEGPFTIQASKLLDRVVSFAGISDTDITLQSGGVKVDVPPSGTRTVAEDQQVEFQSKYASVKGVLNRIREVTESEWWFDKTGTFHFGKPDVTVHRLQFIKDTSAGITTPPYQSVEVVGKGAASKEGWNYNSAIAEPRNNVVKRARIARPESAGEQAQRIIVEDELAEPVFRYVNAEISTQRQAAATARSILDELMKQQADGNITVVGFPEVSVHDGLQMPGTTSGGTLVNNPARDEPPMGGRRYGVYKVTHHLNASDGFITKIKVAGPTNVTQEAFVNAEDRISDTNVDRYVYESSSSGIYGNPYTLPARGRQ